MGGWEPLRKAGFDAERTAGAVQGRHPL